MTVKDKTDLGRLRNVTRIMLSRLEKELRRHKRMVTQPGQDDPILGTKNSLAATLVMLGDLMLKLERIEREGSGSAIGLLAARIDEADVALIQAFTRKRRLEYATPTVVEGVRD